MVSRKKNATIIAKLCNPNIISKSWLNIYVTITLQYPATSTSIAQRTAHVIEQFRLKNSISISYRKRIFELKPLQGTWIDRSIVDPHFRPHRSTCVARVPTHTHTHKRNARTKRGIFIPSNSIEFRLNCDSEMKIVFSRTSIQVQVMRSAA